MNIEALTKARDDSQFAWEDLREALKTASPVEAIVLLRIINEQAKVMNSINEFRAACDCRKD